MKIGRRGQLLALAVLTVAPLIALYVRDGRHGAHVDAELMRNHDKRFDFAELPCEPADRPSDDQTDVRVAYLGAGGILIEWRGHLLATAPHFTRLSVLEAGIGKIRNDEPAIERGLEGLNAADWELILSGHSHYDHFADLPIILKKHATSATLWTNSSGKKMMHAFPELSDRVHDGAPLASSWIYSNSADGSPLPFRFTPLVSAHADHYGRYHYAPGEVEKDWDSWEDHHVVEMREGQTLNYIIDLLDEVGEPAFRLYYQDAVNPRGAGYPPAEWIEDRAVDLAILCAPAAWRTEGHPEELLAALEARHVMPIHYEDFFQSLDVPTRFVASLTDTRMANLLRAFDASEVETIQPSSSTCGPMGERWTMPLLGEWVGFRSDRMLSSTEQ
jgi:L-ascorbate metabolism protein UlaG (beta-lactamase superfamily)